MPGSSVDSMLGTCGFPHMDLLFGMRRVMGFRAVEGLLTWAANNGLHGAIYTSGWPKNQKRCWNRTGSPPPAGSKKVVFRFRSVRSMVMAPASTGRERRRRIVVTFSDHGKSGTVSIL